MSVSSDGRNASSKFDKSKFHVVEVDSADTHSVHDLAELPDYEVWKVCFAHRVPSGRLPLQINDTLYSLDCAQTYDYLKRLQSLTEASALRYSIHTSLVDAIVFGMRDDSPSN